MRTQAVTWESSGGTPHTGVVSWEGGRDTPVLHDDRSGYVSRVVLGGAVLTAVGSLDFGLMTAAQDAGLKFRMA